jgi:GDP/UDP-N,N'-diacetylbacillosamine 2-epimerase (hydrolysing)
MITFCVVSGSRAEYGLLLPLLRAIQKEENMLLQIVVSGTHLSEEYGNTYKLIEADGFSIDEKIEILAQGNSAVDIVKSMGNGLIGFADAFARLKPDYVVILGDRYEALSFAIASYMQKIPIIHLHGGELTEGANDDALRHAITKLSYLHFTATEEYRKRVMQLGENPERVFNVGAIGLDNIRLMKLLDRDELEKELGISLWENFVIITYHPVTLGEVNSKIAFTILLEVLEEQEDLQLIFTMPNADADSRIIADLIRNFTEKNSSRAVFYTSLGQLRYLSALKHCDMVIGNSSSGIIEAPSFGIPTINIGDRQKGRIIPLSVISCDDNIEEIRIAVRKARSSSFREKCLEAVNPYGDGYTTERIINILRKKGKVDSIKKTFFDLP